MRAIALFMLTACAPSLAPAHVEGPLPTAPSHSFVERCLANGFWQELHCNVGPNALTCRMIVCSADDGETEQALIDYQCQ